MRFCDDCGSLMLTNKRGYKCPKCGMIKPIKEIKYRVEKIDRAEPVYLVKDAGTALKVRRTCPRCGNNEAYRNLSMGSGEHAGIKRERIIERYKCIECGNSWTV
ncbi:MAG: hypothetical protein ACLFVP_02710 [Candidatus Bathyarchaeia archaeon]